MHRLQAKAQMSLPKRAVSPKQSLLVHSIGYFVLYAQYISSLIVCNKRNAKHHVFVIKQEIFDMFPQ